MSRSVHPDDAGDVAIIGLSGRFPGARTLDELWHNLSHGIDSIAQFTDAELLAAGVEPELLADPTLVRAGGVLDDVEMFDPAFFGLSPMEAAALDPQQRVFLECAWESLEHAGYDGAAYPGLVGVYAGAAMSSYLSNVSGHVASVRSLGDYQILLGNDKDNVPTLVSYKLDLRGPSLAIQTACSTSLVAVVVACQNLLSYQCDMALAGGVRIALPQAFAHLHQDGGIMSPDGRCRAFDAKAQGTVGGNGVGIVVLKRLRDAIADGDCVHAVIKGAAINNDGAVKVGYTAPSIEGQAQVVAMAHAAGRIDPRSVTFVEAHGTATDLGDPIEVAALTQAFRLGTRDRGFCALASVKANVGHLDTAAGVAGLIKTVLALEHRQIPPAVHFDQPNPKIDFAQSPFFVNTQLLEWAAHGSPRRAGVSSFGIGGTNAHVVVEEAPVVGRQPSHRSAELLVLSARSSAALETMTSNLATHLARHPDIDLADVAYTLQTGRRAFRVRRAVVCRDVADAVRALRDTAAWTNVAPAASPSVAFMFAGQGPQHVRMAEGLYRHEPSFRAELDRCADWLAPRIGVDIRAWLYPPSQHGAEASPLLVQVPVAHATVFAVEYAMARLWMEWGVHPQAMIGHSLGEYVAACLADVFSLEDALATVVTRATLMESLPQGAMLAVPVTEGDVTNLTKGAVSVAAVNGPSLCVASGPLAAIAALEDTLTARGLETRRLTHTRAFHSFMLDPVLPALKAHLASISLRPPRIPLVSGVTGTWMTDAQATDPEYWMRHARETVRFADGVDLLQSDGRVLLEVGPRQTLSSLARRKSARPGGLDVLATQPGANDDRDEDAYALGTLGKLWLSGVGVDWAGIHRHAKRARTPLPTYPFERRRCWIDAPNDDAAWTSPADEVDPAAQRREIADWFYYPSWRRTPPADILPQRPTTGSRWLVFSDTLGVGEALANAVSAQGTPVALVAAGTTFADHGGCRYTIDPRDGSHYEALLTALRAAQGDPETIVHLWSITAESDADVDPVGFEELSRYSERQALGFESLVLLMQALGERRRDAEMLRIIVGSTNVQDVTGRERLLASKATVLGPCRVIPDEYPAVVCRSIDIEPPTAVMPASVMARAVLAEIVADVSDRVVALRGPHRWVEAFEPVRLDANGRQPPLLDRGVYLITGGLGGVGLALAEHLARTCRARLVLVGRSPFPTRSAWSSWIDQHGDDDVTSRRIRQVRALEESGAEVRVETADVADLDAMRGVLERARTQFGPLNGVVHAAGVAGGRLLQFHSLDEAARVIAPKAIGALVLRTLLAGESLDFFLLCSSLSAVYGAVAQADYCAANLFLDAFAHELTRSSGCRAVSVNWDTWRDVGMAVRVALPADLESHRAASLAHGFDPSEGIDAAMRILGSGLTQVAVSTQDLSAALEVSATNSAPEPLDERDWPSQSDALLPRPSLTSEYVAPRDDVQRTIAAMWQALFSIDQVGANDNFFELGGHSLLAVQFISRLRASVDVEVSARDLFNAPTVSGLADIIAQRRPPGDADVVRLEETLALIESMSEQEVRALLSDHE